VVDESGDKFVVEAMLLRWGDTHSAGRTITLVLEETPDGHPFKGLPCGPANGQRMAISVALISDDETEVDLDSEKALFSFNFTRQAAILCNQLPFKNFLLEKHRDSIFDKDTTPQEMVRSICKVETRKAFNYDQHARDAWIKLRGEYELWKIM
jgi:hypothetical protein